MKGFTGTIRRYVAGNRYSGELSNADGTGEIGTGAEQAGRQIAVRFTLQDHYFPAWDSSLAAQWIAPATEPFPEISAEVRQ